MSIVTVPTGNDYSRMTAEILNAAWDQAIVKQTQFEAKIANVTSSWLDTTTPPSMNSASVSAPSVTEPTVTIPTSVSTTDVYADFQSQYQDLVQLLSDKFDLFRNTFFPDEQNAYTAAEDWLQAALADPSGLPSTVAAQIWTDDRDRILADATRAQEDALATFAAKRFPLPPGAAASVALQIQQKAQDEIAESSRKVAIMSVEQFRFLIEKVLSLRQNAMGAAIEYVKALASGPDMASRLVNVGYDAQSKLISSVAQYYGARTEAKKLTFLADQHNADLAQDAAKENLRAELTLVEDKLKALLTECQALAQMTTSLFNNLHASAGVSASDSVSHAA